MRVLIYSLNIKTKLRLIKRGLTIIILGNINVYYDWVIKDDLSRCIFVKMKSKKNREMNRLSIGITCINIVLDNRKFNSIMQIDLYNMIMKNNNNPT